MRNLILALCFAGLSLTGCSNYPKGEPPQWTEESLFAYVVKMATEASGLPDHSAINGDDLVAISRGIDFLSTSGDKWCADLAIEDHYLFFKRSGLSLSITIGPAYVPDPENLTGVYPNEDGTQQVIVAPIDGARQLLGCAATIETDDNGLSFVRTDSFAR